MKETRLIMGMPIAIEVVDQHITIADLERVFSYFRDVEEQFSTFKPTSEISRINRGEIAIQDASVEVKEVFAIAEKTSRSFSKTVIILSTVPRTFLTPAGVPQSHSWGANQ